MNLAAFDNDTVLQSLLNAHIRAGIRLLGRTQHPVTLYVRLGAASDKIFRLETGQPLLEILMILGGAFVHLVRFIGNIVNGVRAVDAHAALDAAADFLAQHSGHVLFLVQIFLVLMNVGETVDPLSGQMRNCRAQILIFRLGRFIIGCTDGIETIHLQLVRPVNQLAVVVNVPLHLGQTFNVILLLFSWWYSFLL